MTSSMIVLPDPNRLVFSESQNPACTLGRGVVVVVEVVAFSLGDTKSISFNRIMKSCIQCLKLRGSVPLKDIAMCYDIHIYWKLLISMI